MTRTTQLLISFAFLIYSVPMLAQNTSRAIDSTRRTSYDVIDTANENKLVALALQSPTYSASNNQNRINELELKKTKNAWLNLLSISYTVNDQSFNKTAPAGTAIVYPKYNFGITVPLGIIFSQGTNVKSARASVAYSKDLQKELARTIKANVLSKYKEYKMYRAMIEIQSELINDVLANATQAEDNFRKGTATVEQYIAAQKTKNDELAHNLTLKMQQDLVKIDIERMIGVPLESVLQAKPGSN
jgi:outer membrane protein TolC